jgi:hypothetical protein
MRRLSSSVLIAVSLVAGSARAQSSTDAWLALMYTPPGALPPLATSTITGEVQSGVALALRYGYLSAPSGGIPANAGGATIMVPAGLGRSASLTVGGVGCRGCSGNLMLGIGGDMRIGERAFDDGDDGSRIALSVNGEIGYDHPHGSWFGSGALVSGEIGAPISFIAGTRARTGVRIVPFVTPALGVGSIRMEPGVQAVGVTPAGTVITAQGTDSGWETGVRFMFGGGIGVYTPNNTFGVDLGFQLVPLGNARPQVGLALTIGGR